MDEEKVLISTYYEEICLHLDENNSTKLAALMTSVTSIVLPINAEIEGNNVNVFKHKSFQFNMDKSYLTSSNFIAERVQSMHDIIVSGNNLLVYGGAGIGKTVCIDVLAQTMSQTEKVKVASQLIEGVAEYCYWCGRRKNLSFVNKDTKRYRENGYFFGF